MILAVDAWRDVAWPLFVLIVMAVVGAWIAHLRIDTLRDRVEKLEKDRKP